ncbi:hypothetical protein EDD18DRAFT_1370675 [Armillaria luteobubalina]|uniref:Uncharacterized protein n=1 Tax=Armillaria luteobubalina TaxID=153913 RepID=A0AA39NUG2_9AGAR|nr:hypothetical protein EDD18DRAFT_1370675 [Armillaria luteobubalina]
MSFPGTEGGLRHHSVAGGVTTVGGGGVTSVIGGFTSVFGGMGAVETAAPASSAMSSPGDLDVRQDSVTSIVGTCVTTVGGGVTYALPTETAVTSVVKGATCTAGGVTSLVSSPQPHPRAVNAEEEYEYVVTA